MKPRDQVAERLRDQVADMNNKFQAAASGEGLLKLAIVDHQRRITVLTRAVEGLKLSHKDEVDRLQLELLRAKGVGTNVPQTRVLGDSDATSVVGDDETRGTPALQEALRALCREFIDIFSTAVRPLPAKIQW